MPDRFQGWDCVEVPRSPVRREGALSSISLSTFGMTLFYISDYSKSEVHVKNDFKIIVRHYLILCTFFK